MEHRVSPDVTEVDYTNTDYIPPDVQVGYWERTNMVAKLVEVIRGERALVDLGCNAGHLLATVGPPCWGYDIAISPLMFGREFGNDVRAADITKDELELAPVVTICEVLEHLPDPHAMVARLNVDPVEYVVASGPYQETPEDHYEQHLWTWDLEGFAAMFQAAGFTVVGTSTVGIFQALVAQR